MEHKNEYVLKVEDLHTSLFTKYREIKAVRGVDFLLKRGEILGIVGESGSGKSITVKSIMQILPSSARVVKGKVIFGEENLLDLREKDIRKIRGRNISMIFQDPMTALNPVLTIGYQLTEQIREHNSSLSKEEVKEKIINILKEVKIPDPELRLKQYPHEFSGGMRQRIMIAMALLNNPDILIADEPTTALDVTIQAQILKIIRELKNKDNKSIILITHDLAVVAENCDRVAVMYAGEIVEEGNVCDIFEKSSHPYTKGLISSLPSYSADNSKALYAIPGSPPDLSNTFEGCPFASRCDKAMKICLKYKPDFITIGHEHKVKCFLHNEEIKSLLDQ